MTTVIERMREALPESNEELYLRPFKAVAPNDLRVLLALAEAAKAWQLRRDSRSLVYLSETIDAVFTEGKK